MDKRKTFLQPGEDWGGEAVPTPGATVALGDDRMVAVGRLILFLCLLAVDIGLMVDYHSFVAAHTPVLLGMIALAIGCLAGVLVHAVPDYLWQRRTIHHTTTLYDDWLARRNLALDLALSENAQGDEADHLPGEEIATGPDLAQLHAGAYRILYRHYALKAETTRDTCQAEEGISQPVWNAVNDRLKAAGIRPTGRSWAEMSFAEAWSRWLQAEAPRLVTWEMASRPQ